MTAPADSFGGRLRAQRERQGVSLQTIAESTKIGASLLAALERDDLSRWPKGIFRRAFLREYVSAVGLPPEPMLAEFARLFPDDTVSEPADANEFRLMLDPDAAAVALPTRARATFVLLELSGVALLGSIAAWVLGTHVVIASGIIGLLYYPIARVYLDCPQRLMRFSRGTVRLQADRRSPAKPGHYVQTQTALGVFSRSGGRRFEWWPNVSRALQLLRATWRRRVVSLRRSPCDPRDETPSTSSEWGTASN